MTLFTVYEYICVRVCKNVYTLDCSDAICTKVRDNTQKESSASWENDESYSLSRTRLKSSLTHSLFSILLFDIHSKVYGCDFVCVLLQRTPWKREREVLSKATFNRIESWKWKQQREDDELLSTVSQNTEHQAFEFQFPLLCPMYFLSLYSMFSSKSSEQNTEARE